MNKQQITDMEKQVLTAIIDNDFYENGFDSILWNDCFVDTVPDIDPKKVRALMSTLLQKGYITTWSGKDAQLELLEPGKKFLLDSGLVDEYGRKIRKK